MDSITNEEIASQYVKIQKHVTSVNKKLRKYKDYSSLLQQTITERIRSGAATPDAFPSLAIDVKPVERAPLNETLVHEFIESMFSQKGIRDAMIERFRTFRREKLVGKPPIVSIKVKKGSH